MALRLSSIDRCGYGVLNCKNTVITALTKYIENISDADIMGVEIATGEPVVYDLDDKLNIISKIKL